MPLPPTGSPAERLEALRVRLRAASLDGLVVTHLPNIFYLTHFRGTAGVVLVTLDRLYFMADFRYSAAVEAALQAPSGPPGGTLVPVPHTYDQALAGLLRSLGPVRVGLEAAHLPVKRYLWLAASVGALVTPAGAEGTGGGPSLVPTDRLVEAARARKDAVELERMRTGGRLLSGVARSILEAVRSGRAERDVAADIDYALAGAGFERPAFETIVASGPHSALPHARPGGRRLVPGDLVVLDFGGVYDGYCLDLSRTVCIGPPGAEQERLHAAVLAAQAAALAAIRPGVRAADVDRAARAAFEARDLAQFFGHGTGHGLGVEVHEEPRITRPLPGHAESHALEPGMVFTVEPGLYVPGVGGVRIEDDVAVTGEGYEALTDAPRGLISR